jgi:hypothetical protein
LRAKVEAERKRYLQANGGAEDWRELELIRFRDMQPRLDGRPLVKGFLDREQTSLAWGETGCGKTFLALDLGLHVAAGRDWFSRKVEQGAVVYVAAEAGRSIINRAVAWRTNHGLDGADIPFAAVTSPIDLCHPNARGVETLITAIRDATLGRPLALVIIDTVSRALAGGNENAPGDMGAFVRSLDRLREEFRCHVLAVHHSGKVPSRGARGHSLLRAAVDTEIEVVRDDKLKVSTASTTKQRDGTSGEQIAFRLRAVELGRNDDGDPVTSCAVEPTDELPQKTRPKSKLPPGAKIALETLRKAIAEAGKDAPASNHIPRVKVVEVEAWRPYYYAGTPSDGKTDAARKKAFQRAARSFRRRVLSACMQTWCGSWSMPVGNPTIARKATLVASTETSPKCPAAIVAAIAAGGRVPGRAIRSVSYRVLDRDISGHRWTFVPSCPSGLYGRGYRDTTGHTPIGVSQCPVAYVPQQSRGHVPDGG